VNRDDEATRILADTIEVMQSASPPAAGFPSAAEWGKAFDWYLAVGRRELASDLVHLRAWGIRLLAEHWPLDALHTSDEPGAPVRIWTQQRPAPVIGGPEPTRSPAVLAELGRLAASDPSSLVRLTLASTMQRLSFSERLPIADGLVTRREDAADKNIPLMVWYALIPLAETNPAALATLAAKSELRATTKYVTRRLTEDLVANADPVNAILAAATGRADDYRSDVLDGLTQGLTGQQGVPKPAGWDAFAARTSTSANADVVAKVRAVDTVFGSGAALADARRVALDPASPAAARRTALQSLLDARVPDLRQLAEQLVTVRSVNAVAATALSTFNEPAIAPVLIGAYSQFDAADRPRLMAALTSRPSFASALLDAVAAGRVPRAAITAIDAQQIRSLSDAALTRRLSEVWGEVRETPEAKRQLMARYRAELTPAQLAAASLSEGRAVYASTCGACHTLYGEGGRIGPDLTGGERRHDHDSLLMKIVDPSSELPVDSRLTIVTLRDGRTVSGIVENRTATTLTLKTTAEPITVPVAEIVSTDVAMTSLMPEGLFEALTPEERRDLVAYLMGTAQVPLPAR
jgi:putative heme-binding domain-containing protein